MINYKACNKCSGVGKYSGIGFVSVDCDECSSSGYIKEEKTHSSRVNIENIDNTFEVKKETKKTKEKGKNPFKDIKE